MHTKQLEKRNEELAILNTLAQRLNREVDLSQTLLTTLQQTVKLLHLETGWIWLLDQHEQAYLAASYNLPPAMTEHAEVMEGTCYCLDNFQEDSLAHAANINEIRCSRLKKLKEGTYGLKYHASVPLLSREKKLGLMNVVSTNWQKLPADTLQLLYTIGDMLSVAIERARLYDQQKQLGVMQERTRLAREIHDTLAQGLSGIVLKLETVEALMETKASAPPIPGLIAQALQLARENLEEARQSVFDLRASPLQQNNLVEALEKLVRKSAQENHLDIRFFTDGYEKSLSLRIETGLYRIAQEALANAVKHADATGIQVTLQQTTQEVHLTVQDDGKGFEVASLPAERFGLTGLNERVRLLQGALDILSSPDQGTTVKVSIPLP